MLCKVCLCFYVYILQASVHFVDLSSIVPAPKKMKRSKVSTFTYRESNIKETGTEETFKASCITPAYDGGGPTPCKGNFI